MRIHVIQTGTIVGNESFMRAASRAGAFKAVFGRRAWFEFPVHAYVLEHDDGHIVVDTGLNSKAKNAPWPLSRLLLLRPLSESEEVGPAMRAVGLRPEDVRLVIPTHLDVDHAGGVGHFPNAEVIVHRREWDFSKKAMGRLRYQPQIWPSDFKPKIYDLGAEAYGPFESSLAVAKGVRLVPIPGHSIAQVGVVVERNDVRVFFGADHVLRADWFAEDIARNRLVMLGALLSPKMAIDSSKRIADFVRQFPTVLVPSHDADAAKNLAANEPLKL